MVLRSRHRLIQHLFIQKEGRSAAAYSIAVAAQRVALQGRVRKQDALAYTSLLLAGKHPNKVKVACAREMVGFVWESLNQAAAAKVTMVGMSAVLLV